ncbi:PAS domain S-box-containing protein [Hydrogenispora ethanolica]|uniref:histidine kinase n=1 Tax=Hydrogenispora ethanolica TaxID=1082276 RepID=A0A4R1SBE9_HYDET|nr:PAS domain S-box protein [Hydrogenispora ethanolica]TCL76885.1 PAS domain S-box-containing protein [Hydrogenispora ethanolica]
MKNEFVSDLKRIPWAATLIFCLVSLLLVTIYHGYSVIHLKSDRLETLTSLVNRVVSQNSAILRRENPAAIQRQLRPAIAGIIQSFPRNYAAGFYSSRYRRVLAASVRRGRVAADEERLSDLEGGARHWFFWSPSRRTWLLQYVQPLTRDGTLVGYSFANVTLSDLFLCYLYLFGGVLLLILVSCPLALACCRRVSRRVQQRLDQSYGEAIQRSRRELAMTLESITDCCYKLDRQWRFTHINPAASQLLFDGQCLEFLGRNIWEALPRLAEGRLRREYQRALDQNVAVHFQYEMVHQPGRWLEIHAYPSEEGLAVFLREITDQKVAEAELQSSRQAILDIVESITDGFFGLNRLWRFSYVNQAAERQIGMAKERLLHQDIWRVFPGLSATTVAELRRAMTEERVACFESPDLGFWCQFHVYPSRNGLSVFFHNISERKQLEATHNQLALIVESSEDAIISTDTAGIILSWNRGAEQIYGYPATDAVGQPLAIIHPDDRHPAGRQDLFQLAQECQSRLFETVRVRRDGTLLNVSIKNAPIRDPEGRIIGMCSIHRDITQQKADRQNLAAERERLLVTLRSIGEAVIAADQDGRIVLMNEKAEQLTGYDMVEASGRPLAEVFRISDTGGRPLDILEQSDPEGAVLVTRDRQQLRIAVHCAPIRDQGNEYGVVLTFEDITERLRTEQELLKAQKLESLTTLAGGIAHDFNNLLAAILANLQLTQMKLEKGQDIRAYLQDTVETTRKASDLTRQLLTFARESVPVRQPTPIGELVRNATQFALRGSKIKARFYLAEDLCPADVDESQISQVIYNLIINAKQAMPRGGVIDIRAENAVFPSGSIYRPGNYIRLIFQDQGVGIPKENLSRIFDPFFTTKREGTGLGLATSYSIINKHNGYIEVQSEPGNGTTFVIYLPAAAATKWGGAAETRSETACSGPGLKLLLMDDEEMILHRIGEMLGYYGHQVTFARDGAETVALYRQAKQSGAPFDVVILDLTVPGGMGAQETLPLLKNCDPAAKVIVSSGYANDPLLAEYRTHGFDGVVSKPYKVDELHKVLKRVARPPDRSSD